MGSHIIDLLASMNRFHHVLYGASLFMSAAERTELRVAIDSIGFRLQALRRLAEAKGDLLFGVFPKAH